jgi:hypothetical protein
LQYQNIALRQSHQRFCEASIERNSPKMGRAKAASSRAFTGTKKAFKETHQAMEESAPDALAPEKPSPSPASYTREQARRNTGDTSDTRGSENAQYSQLPDPARSHQQTSPGADIFENTAATGNIQPESRRKRDASPETPSRDRPPKKQRELDATSHGSITHVMRLEKRIC